MSDTEFFQTRMGKTYYESTMPRLVAALERIAEASAKTPPSAPGQADGEVEVNERLHVQVGDGYLCVTQVEADGIRYLGEYSGRQQVAQAVAKLHELTKGTV